MIYHETMLARGLMRTCILPYQQQGTQGILGYLHDLHNEVSDWKTHAEEHRIRQEKEMVERCNLVASITEGFCVLLHLCLDPDPENGVSNE